MSENIIINLLITKILQMKSLRLLLRKLDIFGVPLNFKYNLLYNEYTRN